MSNTRTVGKAGETAAARYLRRHLYRIVARNYKSHPYELDIVAETPRMRIFVEVKTRCATPDKNDRFGPPSAAVDHHKRMFITRAARVYQATHPTRKRVRFDVIEVYLSPLDKKKILAVRHMKDAFLAY